MEFNVNSHLAFLLSGLTSKLSQINDFVYDCEKNLCGFGMKEGKNTFLWDNGLFQACYNYYTIIYHDTI